MGRKRNPIADDGPIGQFAQRLRDRMDSAEVVPPLTSRAMAKTARFSHAVLADACAGKRLPTWDVTKAFVQACGADDTELARWREDWLQTQQVVGRLRRKLGHADVVVPTHTDTGRPVREGRLRPVQVDLADPEAWVPQPETVQTFDDLLYQLRVLRIARGNLSLRDLSRLSSVPTSTLGNLFSGRRPNYDTFATVVQALLLPRLPQASLEQGIEVGDWRPWREAWTRAEYNRTRPDLTRHRRAGNMPDTSSPDPSQGPLVALRDRLQELYRHQGKPSYRELAMRTHSAVSHTTAHAIIRCQKLPRWGQLEVIVEALAGDDSHLEEFRALWLAAEETSHRATATPPTAESLELYRPVGDPLNDHTGTIRAVAFHPDGHLLATISSDETVRLWRSTREPEPHQLRRQVDQLRTRLVAVRADRDQLAPSACPDDRADMNGPGGVVYDIGDQAGGAERLLAEQRVSGVGDAAVVRVNADDG
ncbi:Helix-turn-helix domain-containing protein [Microbispora rosea]|uniref:Helix-turn-helix domain-containing protein n=1 Tax=Microbispora rosea TaxID=58117 RepID=A0A1N7GJ28_9ACTN|nr:helix-turn-helix domain-containing protein [Microbispora rosea]GIH51685.1 hypothetical protein Mro03_68640 [Microbispora rosea subsp. rosea]SIS12615.1 Helix-turn-helix domain-containing protein [Microbispora rosea]